MTINLGKPGEKRRSEVYQHFVYLEVERKYECKACSHKLNQAKGKSTSNLLKHLNRFHAQIIQATEKKSTIFSLLKSKQTGFNQAKFEKSIIDFIVLTNQPFTIVEDPSFQNSISLCQPSAKFVGADTIKRRMVERFDIKKQKLFELLKANESKISFVLDCWTSSNQIAFQGIIGLWIDSQWNYQQRIIDLDILRGKHTDRMLSSSFVHVLQEFELINKIIAVTTDNAINCDTFFAMLESNIHKHDQEVLFDANNQRVKCLAHIINLACQDAISILKNILIEPSACVLNREIESDDNTDCGNEEFDPISLKNMSVFDCLRNGIAKIRKSTQRREIFRKHCEVSGLKCKELVKDISTRWSSTYFMLKRTTIMREPFENTLRSYVKLKAFLLSDHEWKQVENIVVFLKPFKKMTNYLSKNDIPTMSLSFMIYMELYNHLESITEENGHSALLVKTATAACNKLNKYYPTVDNLLFVAGTILDPRCKLTWYTCNSTHFPKTLINKFKSLVRSSWEANYKPKNVDLPTHDNANTTLKLN